MPAFASVALVDLAGRLLLQERDEHARIDPDRWGLVGGHVDPEESFEDAAYRELAEETEVVVPRGALTFWREFEVWHESYGSFDRVQVWVTARDITDADVVCHEGRRIVFVEPDAALTLPLTAGAGVIVPAFLSSDTYAALVSAAAGATDAGGPEGA